MRFVIALAIPFFLNGLSACGIGTDTSIDLFGPSGDARAGSEGASNDAGDLPDATSESAPVDVAMCGASHCSGETPYCDPNSGRCVACLDDGHCNGDHPRCSAQKTCVDCLSDSHCEGADSPKCLVSEGRCVECLDSSQCGSDICNADNQCSN